MADASLAPRTALDGTLAAGRFGGMDGEAGVRLTERRDLSVVVILARKGQAEPLRAGLASLGYDLPVRPARSEGHDLDLVWMGPDQWLAIGPARNAPQTRNLLAPLAGLCATVPAEDARAIVRIAGPRARDTLAKLLTLDLHPRAFKPGDAAVTLAGIIPTILWQIDAAPTYEAAVPRSFARSFWHWLTDAAAEFGCIVAQDPPART